MSSSGSLRNRKKQTRLQFQPTESSSPVKGNYSQAVQDRLANVRFQRTKEKQPIKSPVGYNGRSLPTPQPTSPAPASIQARHSTSPLSSLRTSPDLPPRFPDINKDRDLEDEDDVVLPPSKRVKRSYQIESDEMGNESSTQSSSELPKRNIAITSSVGSNGISFSTPTRRSSRLANKGSSPAPSKTATCSQRLESVDIPSPSRELSTIGSAESSDDDNDVMVSQPTRRRRRQANQNTECDAAFVVGDYNVEFAASEHKVGKSVERRSKRQHNRDDFVVDNDEIEYLTSEDESVKALKSSQSRRLSKHQELPKTPSQRARDRSKREKAELAEDLLDLQDSEQEESTRKSRTRGGPVTTQRDKTKEHFALLKKRRAGQRVSRIIDSDDDGYGEDSDNGIDIDNVGDNPNRAQIISDDSASTLEEEIPDEAHYADDDVDDFIVEDQPSASRLGRPNTDIPLQFTSFASAKPRELFPHIIEWLVKNKISPAFNRLDDLYNLSFSRVDDQVKAQAGSRLISSAWNSTFKYAILARPNIHVTALPGLEEDLIRTCDACNKSNHPARYDFTFSGKAYSKETLEPVDESDDENQDDDSGRDDQVSHDEQGHILAREGMHFYLGRFCAANAEMGHKLTHWKHHLNEQVLSYLEEQGVLAADDIVRREKLNKKKREKEAESIVDMMQETGMIGELWQGFKDDLEDARIGMEGHERKGGRSKARIGSVRVERDNGRIGDWVDGGKFREVATRLESDSEGE